MKQELVNIFKQAEGKKFTFISLISSNGFEMHSCIENLKIDGVTERVIFLRDEVANWDANITIPLINLTDIEERELENFDIDDSEAEYDITYSDGTELLIQICN